jgi:hypothetical protein
VIDKDRRGYLARVETTEGETAGTNVWRMYFTRHLWSHLFTPNSQIGVAMDI